MTTRAEERKRRASIRAQIAEARKVLRELARSKREALRQIKRDCRTARVHVRERVRAWRKLQAQLLKSADYGARCQARDACARAQRDAIATATTKAEGVRAAIKLQQKQLREELKARRPTSAKRRAGGVRAAIKRDEALEEIANNLPADWLDAFERFKHTEGLQRAIRRASQPGSRLSPSEAVLEYFQEHADLVHDLHRSVEAEAEREWNERMRQLQKASKRKGASLEDVPF